MTLLYLVRHGETEWNRLQRFQGNQDIPLSDEGRHQARLLAERLSDVRFDQVFSSDLSRARETAEIILSRNRHVRTAEPSPRIDEPGVSGHTSPPLILDPRLREIHFGVWEGLTSAEIAERYPDLRQAYRRDPVNTVLTGGESPAQVQKRMLEFYDELKLDHGAKVLIVSHGAAIKALICHLIGLDLRYRTRMDIANTGLSVVRPRRSGGGYLVSLNDTRHLDVTVAAGAGEGRR